MALLRTRMPSEGDKASVERMEAMRYSVFMNVEDISARYLNLALCI